MLRDLNVVRDGKRIMDLATEGVLGSTVPSTGQHAPSFLYQSVVQGSLQTQEVSGWITSHNFPAGSFFAFYNGSYIVSQALADGIYTANWVLRVAGADQPGAAVLQITVGSGTITWNIQIADLVFAGTTRPRSSASMALTLDNLVFAGTSGSSVSGIYSGNIRLDDLVFAGLTDGKVVVPLEPSPSRTFTVPLDLPVSVYSPALVFNKLWVHDPNAVLDYTVDWSLWAEDANDPVKDVDITVVTPGSSLNIVAKAVLGTGQCVAMIEGGGVPGMSYDILYHITTLAGRADDRTIHLQIAER